MRRTAQEIADTLDVAREDADGLLRILKALDLVKFCGERPSPSGRGKGANVYRVVEGAGRKLAAIVKKLEP